MDNLDFLELQNDVAFEALRLKMEDGEADAWVNVTTHTVQKYLNFRILEELEDITRLVTDEDSQKILDGKILRLVASLKADDEQLEV